MAYHFKPADRTVQHGVRRIALSQLDAAVDEIDDAGLDRHEVVHQIRKRCKKLRGLIRLVRPVCPAYAEENAALRDLARSLSPFRDAEAMVETYDSLIARYRQDVDTDRFDGIRAGLVARRDQASSHHADLESALAAAREHLVAARERAFAWKVKKDGFKAVADGIGLTYRRARKGFASLGKHPRTADLHELRKRVKYHGYHMRLLSAVWPDVMDGRIDAFDQLETLLGDDHNLAILREVLCAAPEELGGVDRVAELITHGDRRRDELQDVAVALARRALAETPSALIDRIGCYWEAWRTHPSLALPAPDGQGHAGGDGHTEIERKFLVVADGWRRAAVERQSIRQAFLAKTGQASVRVRIVDGTHATVTTKSCQPAIERAEFEYPVPVDDAQRMLALCEGRIIEKTRHIVPVDGGRWEVDEFHGGDAGLVIAEIELPSADTPVARPPWLGREVTGNPRYYNAVLAGIETAPEAPMSAVLAPAGG